MVVRVSVGVKSKSCCLDTSKSSRSLANSVTESVVDAVLVQPDSLVDFPAKPVLLRRQNRAVPSSLSRSLIARSLLRFLGSGSRKQSRIIVEVKNFKVPTLLISPTPQKALFALRRCGRLIH